MTWFNIDGLLIDSEYRRQKQEEKDRRAIKIYKRIEMVCWIIIWHLVAALILVAWF